MTLAIPFKVFYPAIHRGSPMSHSVRSDFTGLAIAAFIAWKLIANRVISTTTNPVTTNTIHPILMR